MRRIVENGEGHRTSSYGIKGRGRLTTGRSGAAASALHPPRLAVA